MKKILVFFFSIICLSIFGGFGIIKASSLGNTEETAKKSKPYLSVRTAVCEIGDSFRVKLIGAETASYYIDDKTVASVNRKGRIKTKRAGKATLTATDKDGRKYTCEIKVYDTLRMKDSITRTIKSTKETSELQRKYLPRTSFSVKPGMLVNFTNVIYNMGMPEGLVTVRTSGVSNKLFFRDYNCSLQAEVIAPLSEMIEDAYKEHEYKFGIISGGGYRTYETQDRYWQRRRLIDPDYGVDPYHNGVECMPGVSSEHRTGYAIDFETSSEGFDWLAENSYGFIKRYSGSKTLITGVIEEGWHYTYVGKDIAATCYYEGLCLEEYYEKYVYIEP